MNMVKWEPFRAMNSLLDDDFFPTGLLSNRAGWDLAVDVSDDKDNVYAEMNLPGIDPKKVDIIVEDGYLRVSGSREEEKEDKGKNFYSREIRRGSFERVIRLPIGVKNTEARADYHD